MNPKFPIYIITYKRWDTRLTSKALEEMNCPYKIVVDEEDYDKYAAVIDKNKILILPLEYRKNYDTFWKDGGPTGSGAARNFVWDHSISIGATHHWILDDNIDGFVRLNRNKKLRCLNSVIFNAMEDFVLRYDNISMAGPDYRFFAEQSSKLRPYVVNHKIYSCLLIRNDVPFRWRGRYNEDVDLCLRMMKSGWCLVQFKAFLQNKMATQTVKGGNTEQFYMKEGTFLKTKMLKEMHPDLVKMVMRYGRPHHFVDYRPFEKNKLKLKDGIKIEKGINEYGLKLITVPKQSNE